MTTPLRVLIVEDTPLNLELATDLLEGAGFTVFQAPSAEVGLALARREHPDIILMDIRLPGIDGYAAMRELKSDAATRGIPAIALTAQAMKGDGDSALQAGFDGYITKPIDTRSFAQSVRGYLDHRQGA